MALIRYGSSEAGRISTRALEMAECIHGDCTATYMNKGDGRITYIYDASWTRLQGTWLWNCTVTRRGVKNSRYSGTLREMKGVTGERISRAVKSAIEAAIEEGAKAS
ncbi:MAG: hypothetical protein JWM26_4540 [Betaproteobacteria bacterium]|nr:hypothetical protein [Betaproteobacteria bacterium]